MSLYIKIENGLPINHPAQEENIKAAFPNIDLTNTTEFAPFIRLPQPSNDELYINDTQILDSVYISNDNGVSYTDSYFARNLTDEEIAQKNTQ